MPLQDGYTPSGIMYVQLTMLLVLLCSRTTRLRIIWSGHALSPRGCSCVICSNRFDFARCAITGLSLFRNIRQRPRFHAVHKEHISISNVLILFAGKYHDRHVHAAASLSVFRRRWVSKFLPTQPRDILSFPGFVQNSSQVYKSLGTTRCTYQHHTQFSARL